MVDYIEVFFSALVPCLKIHHQSKEAKWSKLKNRRKKYENQQKKARRKIWFRVWYFHWYNRRNKRERNRISYMIQYISVRWYLAVFSSLVISFVSIFIWNATDDTNIKSTEPNSVPYVIEDEMGKKKSLHSTIPSTDCTHCLECVCVKIVWYETLSHIEYGYRVYECCLPFGRALYNLFSAVNSILHFVLRWIRIHQKPTERWNKKINMKKIAKRRATTTTTTKWYGNEMKSKEK